MILSVKLDGSYRWQCDDCGAERNEYPHRGLCAVRCFIAKGGTSNSAHYQAIASISPQGLKGCRRRLPRAPGEGARQGYCLSQQALRGLKAKIRYVASPVEQYL